jgi:hypothetical protein
MNKSQLISKILEHEDQHVISELPLEDAMAIAKLLQEDEEMELAARIAGARLVRAFQGIEGLVATHNQALTGPREAVSEL